MSSSAVTTVRHLLSALRPDQTAVSWQTQFEQAKLDWDDLAIRAIVFGLAPQFHQRLQQWQLTPPPRAFAKLAVTYQAQAKRNQAIYQQLDEMLVACHNAQIQPIALKGVHLATHWYAQPALRPMNDIDLLFTPADLPRAEAILTELGYGGKHKSADLGPGVTKHTSTYRREGNEGATPNPYLSAGGDRMIEPHVSLEESWFGLKVDITPGIRQRAILVPLGNHQCHVLANEDLLLHLCIHFCFHLIQGAPSMVQFTDLLTVTSKGGIDWPLFSQRAKDYRATVYAAAALTLAHKLLAAPVPDAALAQLNHATPKTLRNRIQQLDLEDILQRTQQKPLTTTWERIQRGFQDRAETARWAADWRGRWQVWQTALQIGRSDTGQMLLKKVSS